MLSNLEKYQIILASKSPRRKELLNALGVNFFIKTQEELEEIYPDTLQGAEIVEFLAKQKSNFFEIKNNELIISADTIVCVENKVLGKPTNEIEAKKMLSLLSGKTHQVFTGVCIRTREKESVFSVASSVTFANLTEEEIDFYIKHFRPLDKAGAYGIQEWIGFIGIQSISGSYWNVMGLPLQRLYQELKKF
ncbi:MAG: septum formation protein Maf [Paludibacteraceae bacterium]|nr:septum formation protein Maf [Paludibacteraceae bacterium]